MNIKETLKTKLGYAQETQLYRPKKHAQTLFAGSNPGRAGAK